MAAFQASFLWFPSRRRANNTILMTTVDIASVGNICIDIILPIPHYPIKESEHQRLLRPAGLEIGGSLNALIAASRLGARTAPISYIPDENSVHALLSKHLLQKARAENIAIESLVSHANGVIPTCAALVDEKGVHTFLASNEDPLPDLVDEPLSESTLQTVRNASALIIDGYAFHSERALVKRCAEETEHIWLDPQAAGERLLHSDPLFWEILKKAEGVSLTLEEARVVAGVKGDAHEALDALCGIFDAIVLIKDGGNGCYSGYKDERYEVQGFDLQGRFCDSVGAGDSFLGAFLAARSKGLGMRECCLVGNAMGAATCLKSGAGVTGVGTLEEVRRFLNGAVTI